VGLTSDLFAAILDGDLLELDSGLLDFGYKPEEPYWVVAFGGGDRQRVWEAA
jgi:hypothetical protein